MRLRRGMGLATGDDDPDRSWPSAHPRGGKSPLMLLAAVLAGTETQEDLGLLGKVAEDKKNRKTIE